MPRPARKILALVTTLTAGTAVASPDHKIPDRDSDGESSTVVVLDRQPYLVRADVAPVPITLTEYGRYLGATQPLTGPDGRPGCGNILSKGQSVCEDAQRAAINARLRAAHVDGPAAAREHAIAMRTAARVERAKQLLDAAKAK